MTTTDYHQQAMDFLAKGGITFTAVLIGSDCPPFCEDARKHIDLDKVDSYPRKTHIHGKHYRCTFSREVGPNVQRPTAPLVIDFWNSYQDEYFNYLRTRTHDPKIPWRDFRDVGLTPERLLQKTTKREPAPYDVLACIEKHEQGNFDEWCSDLGYDTDSRRALSVYWMCCEQYKRVLAFFTETEMKDLEEIS